MNEPKLTPWFPASAEPARVGVYEKQFECKGYQFWDGKRWHYGSDTPERTRKEWLASKDGAIPNARRWRGLASDPKEDA